MYIVAILDRLERRKAILKSKEMGMEIVIPASALRGRFAVGETVSLSLDGEFLPQSFSLYNGKEKAN